MVSDDRGQLLLIGAVLIGVTLIGTVVMLNGMQYADAAGTQSENRVLDDAERTEEMVERDVGRLTNQILASDPTNADARTHLEDDITVYNNQSRNMTLSRGGPTVNVTYNDSATAANGKEIEQSSTQEFVVSPGSERELFRDADYLRSYEMTVESLPGSGGRGNSFDVVAESDSDDVWRLKIYNDPDPKIEVKAPAVDEGPCSVGTTPVAFDLVKGETDSGSCPFTGIREAIGTPTSLKYERNGSISADGTHRILADAGTAPSGTTYPVRPGVTIRYRSVDVSYNRTIQVEDPEAPR